jgi:hypothetical protein
MLPAAVVIYSPNEFAGSLFAEIIGERPLNQFFVFEKRLLRYGQAHALLKANPVSP